MTNCDNRLTNIEEFLGLGVRGPTPEPCGPDCCYVPLNGSESQPDFLDEEEEEVSIGAEAIDDAFQTALAALTAVASDDSISDELRVVAADTILSFVLSVNRD